ncbi:MAG TPA: hypothetical protein VN729_08630 [Ktedonobacteraceae bacterium]|nr:hypothetical protein [Ktedonobacteraceae bacterium]
MQKSLYFSYPVRSLLRGGQRTILAIFCVAVGVMAVVALQPSPPVPVSQRWAKCWHRPPW